MIKRYIHLSDIHFGQEKDGTLVVHKNVRNDLFRDCKDVAKTLGAATGILVTGDIAYSGLQQEYAEAGIWLDLLTAAGGCEKVTDVFVIPGNHDVDLSKLDGAGGILQDALRNAQADELETLFDKASKDADGSNPLLDKLQAYSEFAERYGCPITQPNRPLWSKEIMLEDPNRLCVVGMTSVMVSDVKDKIAQMLLSNKQYIFERQDCMEFVVLIHHPLDWFKNSATVKKYLRRARVVISGHEHESAVEMSEYEDGGKTLWINAGATNPPNNSAGYRYSYNWIEFESGKNGNNNPVLKVRIYPRIWDPNLTRFVLDETRLNGESCFSYDLLCPDFKEPTTKISPNGPISSDPATKLSSQPTQSQFIPVVQEYKVEAVEDDEEAFVRLRYLFWKYLSWAERLKVLAALDIFPDTQAQPLPQTMERLILEDAREQKMLGRLWDEMMPYLPKDNREENPFSKKE